MRAEYEEVAQKHAKKCRYSDQNLYFIYKSKRKSSKAKSLRQKSNDAVVTFLLSFPKHIIRKPRKIFFNVFLGILQAFVVKYRPQFLLE